MSIMGSLIIPQTLFYEMISHCREVYPSEACGILAGKDGRVHKVYRMTNAENSAVSYLMDSREQLAVMKELSNQGLDITAIYHSHPYADALPSPKDIDLAFYDDPFYVIVSLAHKDPLIRAFEIKNGIVKEVEILTDS